MRKSKNKNKKRNWVIHAIKNGGKCVIDGEVINCMIPFAANYHTHGMEKYNHLDFQLVLDYPFECACSILNTLADHVQAGASFNDGDYIRGIFLDCDVRLDVYEEAGRQVLRVIVPDENNIFPDEDGCNPLFTVQLLDTELLYLSEDERKEIA